MNHITLNKNRKETVWEKKKKLDLFPSAYFQSEVNSSEVLLKYDMSIFHTKQAHFKIVIRHCSVHHTGHARVNWWLTL